MGISFVDTKDLPVDAVEWRLLQRRACVAIGRAHLLSRLKRMEKTAETVTVIVSGIVTGNDTII